MNLLDNIFLYYSQTGHAYVMFYMLYFVYAIKRSAHET